MPDVRAFRGIRYDMAQVGALSDVVAPPYDVIDPSLQSRLYQTSPYNVIRLELNQEEPGDNAEHNRYSRAARFLRDWRRAGILREEDHPALYLYHQTFEVEGRKYTRKGFLARVRLEPFGQGKIFPHEQTLSGPKADRLALFQATEFNLSPIFGLYPDPEAEVILAAEAGLRDRTPLEAIDHLGVVNQLWPVYDMKTHTQVQGLMGQKPIFIADGHHRYETGLKFRDNLAATGALRGSDDPAEYCMMMLVGMSDPGLMILPTHRLVSGYPGLTAERLTELIAPAFEVMRMPAGPGVARELWEYIEAEGTQNVLGFGTIADGEWVLAKLRSNDWMDSLAPEHSPEWRSLGVSVLHELVLESLLETEGTPACRYVHSIDEVVADVQAGQCDLACLVPPASMEHVESIASGLEKMPPKSTYFYPKVLTGLVLNSLR
jgi:uncharacterized protein (DUF1015 family)